MHGRLLLKLATLTAAAGVAAAVAVPANAANVVTTPPGSQLITYATATSQTILQMAASPTANPFVVETSSATAVFSVTPTGGVIIGGGTPIQKFFSGTHSLVIGPISAHSCVLRAFNPVISGATLGDTVLAMPQANGTTPIETAGSGDVIWTAYVGFGNKVAIKACDVGNANVNLSSAESWVVDIIKH